MIQIHTDQVFSALAEPRRREIVELLADHGQMSSTDISRKFRITAAAISQHLKVLREAEVVTMQKQAQHRMYSINTQTLQTVEQWVHQIENNWEARFTRLDRILKKK